MKFLPTVLFLPTLMFTAACSTIVSGTMEEVHVTSNPPGAVVKADGVSRGVTPAEFELARKRDHVVSIELPGYKPHEVRLKRSFNGWVIGNLAFGGIIGVIVDLSTGAVYALEPNDVHADLQPLGRHSGRVSQTGEAGDQVTIATTLKPQPGWKRIAQLERR